MPTTEPNPQQSHFEQAKKLFLLGVESFEKELFEEAEKYLQLSLKYMPDRLNTLINLSATLIRLKELKKADELITKGITLYPTDDTFYLLKGELSELNNNWSIALDSYSKSILCKNDSHKAYFKHGQLLQKLKHLRSSIQSYDKAIYYKNDYDDAKVNREFVIELMNLSRDAVEKASAAAQIKNYTKARELIEYSLDIDVSDADAYIIIGNVLSEEKRPDEAIVNYKKAIELNPECAEAYYNQGNVLQMLNRLDEALISISKAIDLKPDYFDAYLNLGNVQRSLKLFDQALVSYDKAIKNKPDYAEAYANRGNLFKELKLFEIALLNFNTAVKLKPADPNILYNKSLLLLSLQDFENGWDLYDWRWQSDSMRKSYILCNKPEMTSPIFKNNKKLLIWTEQGVGDQILYASMLHELLLVTPKCFIKLDKRLSPLLTRSIKQVVFLNEHTNIESIDYDEHLPIGSLGKFFRKKRSDFDKTKVRYLLPDIQRSREIKSTLKLNKKLLCGFTWSSNTPNGGIDKSVQLEDLLPIFNIPGIEFVSLQYGNVEKEIIDFNIKNDLELQLCPNVDNFHDLDGHAALIEACDFMIGISNTSAHIAGAIGKKAYLLCAFNKLWYWENQLNGRSLWYPSIQIFEQTEPGQWIDVIEKIRIAIKRDTNEA